MAHEANNTRDDPAQPVTSITKDEAVTAADVIEFSEFLHILAQSYPEAASSPLWAEMVEPMHAQAGEAIGIINRLKADFLRAFGDE